MTINPNPSGAPSKSAPNKSMDQIDRDECLRYLLGELSANESSTFEARMAGSPELVSVLLQQSESICQVSRVAMPKHANNQPLYQSRRWVGALVTIAASLALAFFAWSTTNSTQQTVAVAQPSPADVLPSEDALIAQAWANTSPQAIAVGITTLDIETEDKWETAEESDGSSLSWVMAAVESGVSIDG